MYLYLYLHLSLVLLSLAAYLYLYLLCPFADASLLLINAQLFIYTTCLTAVCLSFCCCC